MTDTTEAVRRASTRTIRMEVSRYRPGEDAEPVFQDYEVPLMADWAVLDGLNYIKDRLDGSLSYRGGRAGWACAARAA